MKYVKAFFSQIIGVILFISHQLGDLIQRCNYRLKGWNKKENEWNICIFTFPRGCLFLVFDLKRNMLIGHQWCPEGVKPQLVETLFILCELLIEREKPERVFFYPLPCCRTPRESEIAFLLGLQDFFSKKGVKTRGLFQLLECSLGEELPLTLSQLSALALLAGYINRCQRALVTPPWFSFTVNVSPNDEKPFAAKVLKYVKTFNLGGGAPLAAGWYGILERFLRTLCRFLFFYTLFKVILSPVSWVVRVFFSFFLTLSLGWCAPALRRWWLRYSFLKVVPYFCQGDKSPWKFSSRKFYQQKVSLADMIFYPCIFLDALMKKM